MRNQRTSLLAGIAALALVAGTGFAAAQDSGKGQTGAMQPNASAPKASTPSTKMEKGGAGKMGETQSPSRESKGAQE